MTISGGSAGVVVERDSAFASVGLTVRDTSIWAVNVTAGSSADLSECFITDNASFGVSSSGGDVRMRFCEVTGSQWGVIANDGGRIDVSDSTVSDNDQGVAGFVQGTVRVAGSVMENNRNGVWAAHNATLHVRDGSRIANNSETGAVLGGNSALNIEETIVEGNGAQGILVQDASWVIAFGTTIRNNGSDGIALQDLSRGGGGFVRPGDDPVQILDNGGWGINCGGPAAITQAQNGFDPAVQFSGNANGATNCP
jgi:hypothetical protein